MSTPPPRTFTLRHRDAEQLIKDAAPVALILYRVLRQTQESPVQALIVLDLVKAILENELPEPFRTDTQKTLEEMAEHLEAARADLCEHVALTQGPLHFRHDGNG